MPRHRSHSVEFKRQVVAAYHAGESLHALGRRHDLSRNLIRIWVEKAEVGAENWAPLCPSFVISTPPPALNKPSAVSQGTLGRGSTA